jgi:hypothetical protein
MDLASNVGKGAIVLKPHAPTNIKGYILQWKGKCSYKEISIFDSAEMIHYHVWPNR